MIASDLLAECEDIAEAVAPELLDRPLYICDGALFDGLPVPDDGCACGWAWPGVITSVPLRDRLGDRWQGPGPIIALHDSAGAKFGDPRMGILQTFLHELGHITPVSPHVPKSDPDWLDGETIRELQIARMEKGEATRDIAEVMEAGTLDGPHGGAFIRRCCHLWSRARLAGWDVPTMAMFGGDCWYVSQPAHYVEGLLPELFAMRSATFAEIEATDPPASFAELWDDNVKFYQTFQGEK